MTDRFSQLPWEDLRRLEGDLPWSALETFADAVVSDPDLAPALFAEYDRAWKLVDIPTFIDLYIPAIFALAAPRLGSEQRAEIGSFLVDRLIEAGHEEAEVTEEALLAASGTMGPVILPKVLDTLASMPPSEKETLSYVECWNLTALAADAQDAAIQERTIQACLGLLEQIERGQCDAFLGISPAWTLALLKYTEAAPLLRRLSEQTSPLDGGADYREALGFLEGRRAQAYERAWERPVREWLESSWEMSREWFVRDGVISPEPGEQVTASQRTRALVNRFMNSPAAADWSGDLAEDTAYIARNLLEYARVYENAAPEELTEPTLRTLLLEVFPRKISGERDLFEKVPPVVAALLSWIASEGILPEGASLAQTVLGWADDIVAAALDPANWGPAKVFTMRLRQAGAGTGNQKTVYERMFAEAQQALEEIPYEIPDQTPITPPIPIVEQSPKVGRNDPCPCGSGKKYKKCCGTPSKSQTTGV